MLVASDYMYSFIFNLALTLTLQVNEEISKIEKKKMKPLDPSGP